MRQGNHLAQNFLEIQRRMKVRVTTFVICLDAMPQSIKIIGESTLRRPFLSPILHTCVKDRDGRHAKRNRTSCSQDNQQLLLHLCHFLGGARLIVSFRSPSLVNTSHECRAVLGLAVAVVVNAGSGDVSVAEPFLNLGDVGLVCKSVRRGGSPHRMRAQPLDLYIDAVSRLYFWTMLR